MEYQWALDAPSGSFKNHLLSADIRYAAIAETKFLQFCGRESGYGKHKGESVTITRIKNVAEPTSAVIPEGDLIPIDQFQTTTRNITVEQIGRAIRFSHFAQLLAHFDLENGMQRKLMEQLRLVLDSLCATAMKNGSQIKFIPTSLTGGTFDTDGTPSTAASQNLTVAHLKTIRDYLMDTIHVPGWKGSDRFVALLSTKACRGIRNDPEFLEWNKAQHAGEKFHKGLIGMVENVECIEVNHTNALANNKGTGGVLGEGIVFGDDACTEAVAEDPELRVAIPGNFGLQLAIAWYGALAFSAPWGDSATDGEAKSVHITSS